MTKSYLLSGILFLSSQYLKAQTVSISGIITDATTGKALEGVVVAIGDSMSVAEAGGETNEKGNYTFTFEAKGRKNVQIMAEMATYSPYKSLVAINGEKNSKNILLTSISTEDVVITASKGLEQREKEVTVSIVKVSQKSINLQATTSIGKVITQIPGIDNLGGQISIRGSSGYAYGVGSRVIILLDGLPLQSGDRGASELDLVPVDNIKSVEVIKGASSVLYGSAAMGGVINIITNDVAEKPTTSIRYRQGMYDRPRNRDLDWDGSSAATFRSAHLFHQRRIGNLSLTAQTDLMQGSGYIYNTDSKSMRAFLSLKYKPKSIPGLIAGINAGFSLDKSGTTIFWDRYNPTKWSVVGNPQDTISLGGGLYPNTGEGVYNRLNRKLLTIDPNFKYLTNKGHLFWYRGRLLKEFNNSYQNYITYNDFIYQQAIGKYLNWVSGITGSYTHTVAPSIFGGTRTQSFAGVYTQVDGKYKRLNVSLGLRFESIKTRALKNEPVPDSMLAIVARNQRIIEKRANQPILRAGLNYEVWRGANVRSSFGQAFRAPSIAEYFATVGISGVRITPNLEKLDSTKVVRPEKGYSTEIGFRQMYQTGTDEHPKLKGYIDIAAFKMQYKGMMEFGVDKVVLGNDFSTTAYFTTRNVAKARILGVELTTMNSYQVNEHFSLNFSGGFTYIDPKNLNAIDTTHQLDLSFFNISQYNIIQAFDMLALMAPNSEYKDNPSVLKYRNRWLVRNTFGFTYQKIGFNANYRYRSFTQQIDQYLYLIVGDLEDFRKAHPNGEHVLDLTATYNTTQQSTLSFNVDNIANVEYFTIPGTLGEQRKFTVQYMVRF